MRARIPPAAPVVGLCLMALVLEGYDLLMYGTVVPSLLTYTPWDLDATDVGMLGSLTGIGMLVGALLAAAVADRWGRRRTLLAAAVADRWGRRRTLLAAVVMFSTAMGACAIAPTPEVFGAGRFAVGLGAGVLMPTAAATLIEFAEPRARARSVAMGFVGTCIGGILAGVGTTGTQILLNMFIGSHYPASSRATGLGMALGVGRIGAIVGPTYGGVLVAIETGTNWQLAAFAAPAVVGAILTVLVPQRTPIHRFAQTRRPSAAADIDRKAVS